MYIENFPALRNVLDMLPLHEGHLVSSIHLVGVFRDFTDMFNVEDFMLALDRTDLESPQPGIVFRLDQFDAVNDISTADALAEKLGLPLPKWVTELVMIIKDALFSEVNSHWGIGFILSGQRGASLGAHIDPDDVYTLQLCGEKHWVIGPPDLQRVRQQTDAGVIKRHGTLGEWSATKQHSMEFTQPLEVCMNPGDFLAVPAFSAHQVQATEDGMHLSISVSINQEQIWKRFVSA